MKRINKINIFMIMMLICTFIFSINVHAADTLYRFCHNDHDMLIIGQVTEVSDEHISVKVLDRIVSDDDLNVNHKRKQLIVDNVDIKMVSIYSELRLEVNDYILASLNKSGLSYVNANGIYKVDGRDKSSLQIIDSNLYKGDIKAIESFVHSDGKITEYYFGDGQVGYHDENNNDVIIYDENENKKETDNENITVETVENSEENNEQDIEEKEQVKEIDKKGISAVKSIKITIIAIIVLFLSIICYRTFIISKKRK